VWTSAKLLLQGVFKHWVEALGGTAMALLGLVSDSQAWKVPPAVWIVLSAALFLYAILKAFHDVRVARDAAEREASEQRNCREIADKLTGEYEFGVHELLWKAPNRGAARDAQFRDFFGIWSNEVFKWNDRVKELMIEAGCTTQEITLFWTIEKPQPDRMMIYGDVYENAMVVHENRIQRLWDIIQSYAAKAEPQPSTQSLVPSKQLT
jgi:hypothetical protein